MCGIAGIVYRDRARAVAPSALERMLNAIRHRGPDDQGTHLDGGVALGMRRLSIIDLSGGRQPMFDEAQLRTLVFNGEIYNYRDLRTELLGRGHTLKTTSDSETVVHLYEDFGAECVHRLRGMFSFAVWDASREELFLARDRFGIKPLYYSLTPDMIAFSSELKSLHAVGLADGDLDWQALESLFRIGYIPAPRSPFQNIQKLEAGHWLRWRRDREPIVERYWDLPTGSMFERSTDPDHVLELLDESVAMHTVSDVPVAAFLSGGLDSSAVVGSMVAAGESVRAFTVRFEGTGSQAHDEVGLARLMADRHGVDLDVISVAPKVEDLFERIVWALDEPLADESALPSWLICEAVAKSFKVALVGTGGDELFAGYRRHKGLQVSSAWHSLPAGLRGAAARLAQRLPESRRGGLGVTRLKRFTGASGGSPAQRYLGLQQRLQGEDLFCEELRPMVSRGYAEQVFEAHGGLGPTDSVLRMALYLDYKTYLPEDLLHVADRISMAHSLELRVPFVDHRLVEALFQIQDRERIRGREFKRLLRTALRSRVPKAHYSAPKRGFVGPTAMWLRNELSEMLGDELSPTRLKDMGFFDPKLVERLRTEHASYQQNHEGVLWALLCFVVWHRKFVSDSPRRFDV